MDTDTLREMFDPMNNARNMTYSDIINQVHEMRESEPDDINMTDEEIANAIYRK